MLNLGRTSAPNRSMNFKPKTQLDPRPTIAHPGPTYASFEKASESAPTMVKTAMATNTAHTCITVRCEGCVGACTCIAVAYARVC